MVFAVLGCSNPVEGPTLSGDKAITAFGFANPAATGVVDGAAKSITVTVPTGTTVTALGPTIAITGASVNPASGWQETSPVRCPIR